MKPEVIDRLREIAEKRGLIQPEIPSDVFKREVPFRIPEICEEYFDFKLEPFHVEILESMFCGGRMVVSIPSDHGKSTLATFLFPILSLMNNPDESHIICAVNINDSKRRVQAIQRELETNQKLIRDYPWVAKPREKGARNWSTTSLTVQGRILNKPNPSVIAAAIGSGDIRGRRGKLIMDDIEGIDARYSPLKRQQLYDFVKFEAVRCYENERESYRPLLIALGTPFDVDSLYFRLESEDWNTVRYPVYIKEYETNSQGEPWWHPTYLWPAQAEKVEKMRRSLSKEQFSVMYLMDPTGGDSSVMSYSQLLQRVQQAKFAQERSATFVSLDPASGSNQRRADYSGIVVGEIYWGQGEELPELKVIEAHHFTQGLFEQVHMCAYLANRYKCPVIYEANSQQGNDYANAFMHLHPETQLIRHYTTAQNKGDRMGLTVVKTLIRESKLEIPEVQQETEGVRTFLTEIRDLGQTGTHDHVACAVWFIVHHAYQSVRFYNGPKIMNSYGSPQIGAYKSPYFGGRPVLDKAGGFGRSGR